MTNDLTIDKITSQLVAWLSRGRCFGEPLGAEGEDGRETHHGERYRVTVDHDRATVKAQFWTATNVYSIVARPRRGDRTTYLGAGVRARAKRPGEGHVRGADLTDGPFCEETWNRVLADVVSYEAQVVERAAEPVAIG